MSSFAKHFPFHLKSHYNSQSKAKGGRPALLSGWYTNWRTRRQLARLPDFMLKDIGVSQTEAEQESQKPFWKN